MKKLISIVVPCYKEEKNISLFYAEFLLVWEKLIDIYEYEIIFINDGSIDNTWEEIQKICNKDERVKGIDFSRNFGKEIALSAGIESAKGDSVITLDGDGQHPLEKIPDFLAAWEDGYDMVYNRRPVNKGASFMKKMSSIVFYKLHNVFSDFKLEKNATDYRLLDRKLVDSFLRFGERNRMYRGLTEWMGYKKKVLVFDAKERLDKGESSYGFGSLFNLAINSLTSFSVFPLKMVGYLGFVMTFVSGILFLFVIIDKLTFDKFDFSNIAAILLVNTILIGIVLMSLGLIALYIARIHQEVQGRPMYFVREKLNFPKK